MGGRECVGGVYVLERESVRVCVCVCVCGCCVANLLKYAWMGTVLRLS